MRTKSRLFAVFAAGLILLTALVRAQAPLAPDGVAGQIYYAPFPVNIALDGDLNDWQGVPRVTLPPDVDLTSGQPAVTFAAAADGEFLYLMADVIDTNIIAGQHQANYWNEDSVEFYINATGDLELTFYRPGVAQITIPAVNIGLTADEAIIAGVQGALVGARALVVQTPAGWTVEAAAPLQSDFWSITPEHGGALGFQVHLNGASQTDRDTKLIWSIFDRADQSYNNPSLFGQLIFFEVGQTDVPQPGDVVEAAAPPYIIVDRASFSYTLTRPQGAAAPPPVVYGTRQLLEFSGRRMATNEWWSSLAWKRRATASEDMYPHPLALRAELNGLGIGYPDQSVITAGGRKYEYPYAEDLRVGLDGLEVGFAEVLVADYSDWTVTATWGGALEATMGHGMPFVYFRRSAGAGDALVTFNGPAEIIATEGGAALVTVNGHAYGLFAPSGSEWTVDGSRLRSSLNNLDYFSVALLPDGDPATFAEFRAHAFAFITGGWVEWAYDAASAAVHSTFTVTTEVMEGAEHRPLLALYRHQWLNTNAVNTEFTYVSPRGEMRVLRGSSFTTTLPFTGVLPWLPDVGGYDRETLYAYVDQILRLPTRLARLNLPGADGNSDTYWTGKGLNRLAMLVPIAEQVGHLAARDQFLDDIRATLEDWFTVADGDTENLFYYDRAWGALIGYPAAGFGYNTSLNDHHFHNAYFILASSILALHDPAWVEAWGEMVNLLARDANSPHHDDPLFPRLRSFDPYAGHSWASGAQEGSSGANQESSSEAVNFAAALILWGQITGDMAVRDLGIYLYATETSAIHQYWFDVDGAVFPADFTYEALGILWGDGGLYNTWFSDEPEAIHAINFLPITGASLYLGHHPDYVLRNFEHMLANNGEPESDFFVDILWEHLALAEPLAALERFNSRDYEPEWGETRAHTYHWLHTLNALGRVDPATTADTAAYAVFARDGARTYIAYNFGTEPLRVTFSDGFILEVPALSMAAAAP